MLLRLMDLRQTLPTPLATACAAARSAHAPHDRVKKLLALAEVSVRYLALLGCARCLPPGQDAGQSEFLQILGSGSISFGRWTQLLREADAVLDSLGETVLGVDMREKRSDLPASQSFLRERFDFRKERFSILNVIERVVTYRNDDAHLKGDAAKTVDAFQACLEEFLANIPVLESHELLRVSQLERTYKEKTANCDRYRGLYTEPVKLSIDQAEIYTGSMYCRDRNTGAWTWLDPFIAAGPVGTYSVLLFSGLSGGRVTYDFGEPDADEALREATEKLRARAPALFGGYATPVDKPPTSDPAEEVAPTNAWTRETLLSLTDSSKDAVDAVMTAIEAARGFGSWHGGRQETYPLLLLRDGEDNTILSVARGGDDWIVSFLPGGLEARMGVEPNHVGIRVQRAGPYEFSNGRHSVLISSRVPSPEKLDALTQLVQIGLGTDVRDNDADARDSKGRWTRHGVVTHLPKVTPWIAEVLDAIESAPGFITWVGGKGKRDPSLTSSNAQKKKRISVWHGSMMSGHWWLTFESGVMEEQFDLDTDSTVERIAGLLGDCSKKWGCPVVNLGVLIQDKSRLQALTTLVGQAMSHVEPA